MGVTGPLSKLSTRWTAGFAGRRTEDASTLVHWLEGRNGPAAEPVVITPTYLEPFRGDPLAPGARVSLKHTGAFQCTSCGKGVKKLFDGYCFPCLRGKAEADQCVMNPHQCHFLGGTCREPSWGLEFCYKPHFVYLSFTDKFKVGITREGQVPTRWIDQGATAACLLARVGSRHQAGVLEKILSEHVSDRSHWSKMLQAGNARPLPEEFLARRDTALAFLRAHPRVMSGEHLTSLPQDLGTGTAAVEILRDAAVAHVEFPLPESMPAKIVSTGFDKNPLVEGELLGVKGQYLVFGGGVFNVRRHEGYVTESNANCSSPG